MDAARDEGKKRSAKEEAEAEVHQAFRRAANALSQLYAQGVASQKANFRDGERSAMVRQLNPLPPSNGYLSFAACPFDRLFGSELSSWPSSWVSPVNGELRGDWSVMRSPL
jgi:hypothetical protein